jgi:hypothetical protein
MGIIHQNFITTTTRKELRHNSNIRSRPYRKSSETINFPLIKSEDRKDFNIIVFGDPQPYTQKQIEYFKRGIVQEVKNLKEDYVFGISLGDLVGDDLSLQPHYADAVKEIGLPWYNVMGNHDMNYDATTDEQSDATFKKILVPAIMLSTTEMFTLLYWMIFSTPTLVTGKATGADFARIS